MDEISAALIQKSLDGLNQRYLYTAQNIANSNTPGYRPVEIRFEEALRAAAGQDLQAIRNSGVTMHQSPADSLRLDLELAEASQTAMRYGALIEILGRQMALHRTVIGQGGR